MRGNGPGEKKVQVVNDIPLNSGHALRAALLDRWPALTDDDLDRAGDVREFLVVRIVERYGISLEWCERHFADWVAEMGVDGRIAGTVAVRRN